MKPYLAHLRMTLRLMMRNRAALFFGYLLPLGFFFVFGQMGNAARANPSQLLTLVLTLGVLGSGFFGTAMYAVMNREQNILRRFKVSPQGPMPMLAASLFASLVNYLPMAAIMILLANRFYGMPMPSQPVSLFLFVSVGLLAFCSIGNIIAAVVNSMQEASVISQLFYLPMLLLSGATFPTAMMPEWLQSLSQFLPSTHYALGLQSIFLRGETVFDSVPAKAVGALTITVIMGTFLALKLFRWEKEEKMQRSAKLWLVGILAPFLILGVYQAYARENVVKSKILARELLRSRAWLIKDARIFVGDGTVIERGSVLLRNGKIVSVFPGQSPDADSLNAEEIDASGKTLLPGLIDVHAHISSPGVFVEEAYTTPDPQFERALAAYLYSGVIAVKSVGDGLDVSLKHRAAIGSGERAGAEFFVSGPMFTAEDGHGTEFLRYIPEQYRATAAEQIVRLPKSADDARKQVAELKAAGVDGIKIILEAGGGTTLYNRLDASLVNAIAAAARGQGLPVVSHTGSSQDVADALAAGVDGVEHGSMRDLIPAALFAQMREKGVTYNPTLAVLETMTAFIENSTAPLDRTMVQQVMPRNLLDQGRAALARPETETARAAYRGYPLRIDAAKQNLLAAFQAGVTLVTGTDSGNPMLVHGPAIHRELQLWVEAGVPPAAALQAATHNAARLLRAQDRIGVVKQGYEASLLLVDGNPLTDIAATERISSVFFKGERVNRTELFDQK